MKKFSLISLYIQLFALVAYWAVMSLTLLPEKFINWYLYIYYPSVFIFDKAGLLQSYTGVFYIIIAAPLLGMIVYSVIIGASLGALVGRRGRAKRA